MVLVIMRTATIFYSVCLRGSPKSPRGPLAHFHQLCTPVNNTSSKRSFLTSPCTPAHPRLRQSALCFLLLRRMCLQFTLYHTSTWLLVDYHPPPPPQVVNPFGIMKVTPQSYTASGVSAPGAIAPSTEGQPTCRVQQASVTRGDFRPRGLGAGHCKG